MEEEKSVETLSVAPTEDNSYELSTVSKEKIKMQSEYKLGNNIYMETNYSANEITGMVTVFMNQLNYSKEDLKIYLSEKK